MVDLKKQDFWPRINILKGKKILKKSVDESKSKSAKITELEIFFDHGLDHSMFQWLQSSHNCIKRKKQTN